MTLQGFGNSVHFTGRECTRRATIHHIDQRLLEKSPAQAWQARSSALSTIFCPSFRAF
jgi:hypothetical protein